MSKLDKMAQKDAEAYLAAEMFYGEGAGIRRKLVNAELEHKWLDPMYADAFNRAYEALDKTKFAKMAIKERKSADRAIKTGQNLRALKSGNLNNLTTGVFLIAGGYIIAKQTGYDKVIEAKAKELYGKAKQRLKKADVTYVYNIAAPEDKAQ